MELHIFRHGETNWNAEGRAQSHMGSTLTKLGEKQASILAQKVKGYAYEKIYSSSSLRARQTTEIIWPNRHEEIIYLDDLKEIYLGPWEGQLYSDIAKRDPKSHNHFFKEPHLFLLDGAESFNDLTTRAVKIVDEIYSENKGRLVALVGHGAFIKALLTKLEHKNLSQIWHPPFMQNCAHNIIKFHEKKAPQVTLYAD